MLKAARPIYLQNLFEMFIVLNDMVSSQVPYAATMNFVLR
jgi:hypothetical protein